MAGDDDDENDDDDGSGTLVGADEGCAASDDPMAASAVADSSGAVAVGVSLVLSRAVVTAVLWIGTLAASASGTAAVVVAALWSWFSSIAVKEKETAAAHATRRVRPTPVIKNRRRDRPTAPPATALHRHTRSAATRANGERKASRATRGIYGNLFYCTMHPEESHPEEEVILPPCVAKGPLLRFGSDSVSTPASASGE
jgi:hypothetical protein